jgi:20S proteasome alpha/beta subunit
MAGGKNQSFRSDPADFLAQNLVVVNIQQLVPTGAVNPNGLPVVGPKFNAGAVITVDIRKTDRFYAQNSNGDAIDACELVEATGNASR